MQPNIHTNTCYLKLSEVCHRYSVGKSWVYDQINDGNFPKSKKFGYMSRWSIDDLLQWEIDNGWRDQEKNTEAEAS